VFLEPGVCALLVVVGFGWSWAWSRRSLLRLLGRYLGSVPVPGGPHLAVWRGSGRLYESHTLAAPPSEVSRSHPPGHLPSPLPLFSPGIWWALLVVVVFVFQGVVAM